MNTPVQIMIPAHLQAAWQISISAYTQTRCLQEGFFDIKTELLVLKDELSPPIFLKVNSLIWKPYKYLPADGREYANVNGKFFKDYGDVKDLKIMKKKVTENPGQYLTHGNKYSKDTMFEIGHRFQGFVLINIFPEFRSIEEKKWRERTKRIITYWEKSANEEQKKVIQEMKNSLLALENQNKDPKLIQFQKPE